MSNKSRFAENDNAFLRDVANFMGERRFFYPSIAAIAAMLLVAAAGHLWLPRADIALPLVEGCRLDRQACSAALPGGGNVEVALEPRPVPTSAPVRIVVTVGRVRPSAVAVRFEGVDMNMGLHRVPLQATGGHHVGEATLPVCVTGRMVWQATVELEIGRENVSVPFRFESGL